MKNPSHNRSLSNFRLLLMNERISGKANTRLAFLGAKAFNKFQNKLKTETSMVKFKTACKDLTLTFNLFFELYPLIPNLNHDNF